VDGFVAPHVRFVSTLKERELYDNSIIVVTSDHGEALGEDGRNGHSTRVYPEMLRIQVSADGSATAAGNRRLLLVPTQTAGHLGVAGTVTHIGNHSALDSEI
jgi:predicted AlkP superfamily pyrophosphatase or phosphodiesterase